MTRSAYLKLGAIGALYLLWLATWLVLGSKAYGPAQYSWDHATVAAITGIAAFYASRRSSSPYVGFLVMQGLGFVLLAGSWVSFQGDLAESAAISDKLSGLISDSLYASCVFVLMCAWGYLALERWHSRPLTLLTTLVFIATMAGLGVIFASFYYTVYKDLLDSAGGRLDAVTAALEFVVLATGLLCILLREPPVVVWMLVGTAILMAGDMAYSIGRTQPAIEPIWMLGQFLLLSAVVGMPTPRVPHTGDSAASTGPGADASARSGLSGMLILVSLGAVLLSPLVWYLPVDTAWKSFSSVLFIVALVMILVWMTDRFDDTVNYLRDYVRRVHQARLNSEHWRNAPPRIRAVLHSTALGAFLDEFRDSAARLKEDVLFLGPERLYAPPKEYGDRHKTSCFIMMPFSMDWSADVHRILADACRAAGVHPVRGDDLFTPTDILEDIWQSINAADFVIADITGRNPNVLYELGIAHTLAKPVLILSKSAADIPIDLATRRVILYGQSQDIWREDLARSISQAIAQVVQDYGITAKTNKA